MEWNGFQLQSWALLGLPITSLVSILLLSLHLVDWKGSEELVEQVIRERTSLAIAVQIISHTLGMVQVQALCSVARLHLRTAIIAKPITLEFARFLNSISSPRPLWSRKHLFTVTSILLALLSLLPGALWSGALTPVTTTAKVSRIIHIPSYEGFNIADPWNNSTNLDPWLTRDGIFTFKPNHISDQLIGSARQASARNISASIKSQTLHEKLDNTGYTYAGRSYGAGAAVGFEKIRDTKHPLWYQYNETSIIATAKCQRNNSANFGLVESYSGIEPSHTAFMATLGYSRGSTSDGTQIAGQWHYGVLFQDLFAIAKTYNEEQAKSYIAVTAAAGSNQDSNINPWLEGLSQFNRTQCEVQFAASDTLVQVNTTDLTIKVSPSNPVEWPYYAHDVSHKASTAVSMLSQVDNGFGFSRLGRALLLNTITLRNLREQSFSTKDIPEDILLDGLSEFVISVVDNMLVAISAARYVGTGVRKPVKADVEIPAVVLGNPTYIYTIFGINLVIVILCSYHVFFNRTWTKMAHLDLTDIADVALNASKGGKSLFECVEQGTPPNQLHITLQDHLSKWPAIIASPNKSAHSESMTELADPLLRKGRSKPSVSASVDQVTGDGCLDAAQQMSSYELQRSHSSHGNSN